MPLALVVGALCLYPRENWSIHCCCHRSFAFWSLSGGEYQTPHSAE